MMEHQPDKLIEEHVSKNTKILIYQNATGMYYGSVWYKNAHLYYSAEYAEKDLIPILCRAWIKVHVNF